MVVADRYCFGSFPSREEIEIREGRVRSRPFAATIALEPVRKIMDGMKIDQRHDKSSAWWMSLKLTASYIRT